MEAPLPTHTHSRLSKMFSLTNGISWISITCCTSAGAWLNVQLPRDGRGRTPCGRDDCGQRSLTHTRCLTGPCCYCSWTRDQPALLVLLWGLKNATTNLHFTCCWFFIIKGLAAEEEVFLPVWLDFLIISSLFTIYLNGRGGDLSLEYFYCLVWNQSPVNGPRTNSLDKVSKCHLPLPLPCSDYSMTVDTEKMSPETELVLAD